MTSRSFVHSTSSSYILFIINLLHQVEFGNHLQFHMTHPKSMSICKYCTLKKIENIQSFRNMQISSHLQELFKNCRVKAKILVFPVPWLSLLRLFVNMNMGSYPQDLISICGNIIYQVFATYLWSFPILVMCTAYAVLSFKIF